ncbi:MAG: hypothetical protein WBG46_06360 [Nonlabens sp.]
MRLTKRLILCIAVFFILFTKAQEAESPTLSVGLESLTFGQGTIDVEALKRVVARKQNELKREGLKRFVFERLPEYNYTSKIFLQSCILTLLEEKNQDIVEKELLELSTNYAIVLGFSELMYIGKEDLGSISDNEWSYYDSIFPDGTEEHIKRQLFIDIVGTVLSNNQSLKRRGFFDFDSRLDYRLGQLYKDLNDKIVDNEIAYFKPARKELSSFDRNLFIISQSIDETISNYMKSYEFIREIIDRDLNDLDALKSNFLREAKVALSRISEDSIVSDLYTKEIKNVLAIEDRIFELTNMTESLYEEQNNFNYQLNGLKKSILEYNSKARDTANYSDQLINQAIQIDLRFQFLKYKRKNIDDLWRKTINLQDTIKIKGVDTFNLVSRDSVETKDEFYLKTNIKNPASQSLITLLEEKDIRVLESKPLLFDSTNLKEIKYILNSPFRLNKSIKKKYGRKRDSILESYIPNKQSLNVLLSDINKQILDLNLTMKNDSIKSSYSKKFTEIFSETRRIASKNVYDVSDIIYLNKEMLPILIEFKIFSEDNQIFNLINKIDAAIALMYYHKTSENLSNINMNEEIISFLNFISRINKLDRAVTFSYVIQILDETYNFVEKTYNPSYDNKEKFKSWKKGLQVTESKQPMDYSKFIVFKALYNKLINNIEKYTIIDDKNDVIEIDLVSFLNSFVESFENADDRRHFGLYFTLGISQNLFLDDYKDLNAIGFASEKIGVKYRIWNFKQETPPNLASKPIRSYDLDERNPFINQIYAIGYGSGLLYNVANLTTNSDFEAAHIGAGIGARFFNSLDVNLTFGIPFLDDESFGKKPFVGLSFDVSIGEYLKELKSE